MKLNLKRFLTKYLLVPLGLHRLDKRIKMRLRIVKYRMTDPPYGKETLDRILSSIDVVRYGTIALAMHRIDEERIPGDVAEVGVYQGRLSAFLASLKHERHLHLFDTFTGFDDADQEDGDRDERFQETSPEHVKKRLGKYSNNVHFHVGLFPDTATGIADERFAFVMLDVDRYVPTNAGLEVFYGRCSPGGYIFVHDYNKRESNFGASRALNEFLADKPERLVEIPDQSGSAFFRKV